jgi:transmembrane 9 superfamily protein 2/4
VQTAFLFPGVVFVVFFILNFFVWGKGSSGAVPFGTLFALLFLWFGISVPLCFVGSYFGFRKKVMMHPTTIQRHQPIRWFITTAALISPPRHALQKIEFPVRTNMIPRQIPDQSWYMQSLFSVVIGGILPFGAVFIELFFILSSVWLNQVRTSITTSTSLPPLAQHSSRIWLSCARPLAEG